LDIAALANSPTGGVIAIGFTTVRDSAGRDVIRSVPGCGAGSINVEQYVEVVRSKIVPSIEGLDMRLVEWNGRHLLAIHIPSQPHYVQPFIVRGGVVKSDKVSGAAFTIPRRIGSSRWNLSAEAVHSLLVAARLALANSRDVYADLDADARTDASTSPARARPLTPEQT